PPENADSGAPPRLALRAVATSAMAAASPASASQMASQRRDSRGSPAIAAVASALTPISTPPHPGTAVNAPARSIVSRMKRRFSIAWSCSAGGLVRSANAKNFITQSSNSRQSTVDSRQSNSRLLRAKQQYRDFDQMPHA